MLELLNARLVLFANFLCMDLNLRDNCVVFRGFVHVAEVFPPTIHRTALASSESQIHGNRPKLRDAVLGEADE